MSGSKRYSMSKDRRKVLFVGFAIFPTRKVLYAFSIVTELKAHFPDFVIVRRVNDNFEFILLEPHYTGYADSVPKLKGMAEYSERCTTVSRNEMMRIVDTATGKKVESLDAASSLVRNDIKYLIGPEDLNNLFAKYNK